MYQKDVGQYNQMLPKHMSQSDHNYGQVLLVTTGPIRKFLGILILDMELKIVI